LSLARQNRAGRAGGRRRRLDARRTACVHPGQACKNDRITSETKIERSETPSLLQEGETKSNRRGAGETTQRTSNTANTLHSLRRELWVGSWSSRLAWQPSGSQASGLLWWGLVTDRFSPRHNSRRGTFLSKYLSPGPHLAWVGEGEAKEEGGEYGSGAQVVAS
jgi:hypothetical protein